MLKALLHPLLTYQEHQARKRLAQLVRDTRSSFECERFRRNRAAQIKRRAKA